MSRAGHGTISILTYHSLDDSGSVISVAPRAFAAQMQALADAGLRGISLGEAVAHRAARNEWPRNAVVITFDDGYANFFTDGLPALQRHEFSATVFVISGHVDALNDWGPPPARLGRHRMLSTAQVRAAAASGIEIGAHTRTHRDLSVASAEDIAEELSGSRRDLESLVAAPVESFAYPYGRCSRAAVSAARRTFRAACTTHLGRAAGDDAHLLPRLDAYYMHAPRALLRSVRGDRDWYLALRRWARAVRRLEVLRAPVA